jgi:hypothetical protein
VLRVPLGRLTQRSPPVSSESPFELAVSSGVSAA